MQTLKAELRFYGREIISQPQAGLFMINLTVFSYYAGGKRTYKSSERGLRWKIIRIPLYLLSPALLLAPHISSKRQIWPPLPPEVIKQILIIWPQPCRTLCRVTSMPCETCYNSTGPIKAEMFCQGRHSVEDSNGVHFVGTPTPTHLSARPQQNLL